MSGQEQSFSDYEQRFFLAEILKESNIPPAEILRVITDRHIDPRWTAMRLPIGRSVDSCRAAFHSMLQYHRPPAPQLPSYPFLAQRPPSPRQQPHRLSSELSPGRLQSSAVNPPSSAHPRSSDRPFPHLQTPTGDVPLQVRPTLPDPSMQSQFSQFAPINSPGMRPGQTGFGSGGKGKKRGRPSKAEKEVREAEARALGEVYPPPKKTKLSRPSDSGTSTSKPKGASTSKEQPQQSPQAGLGFGLASGPATFVQTSPVTQRPVAEAKTPENPSRGFGEQMDLDTPESRPGTTTGEPAGDTLRSAPASPRQTAFDARPREEIEEMEDAPIDQPPGPTPATDLQPTSQPQEPGSSRAEDPTPQP